MLPLKHTCTHVHTCLCTHVCVCVCVWPVVWILPVQTLGVKETRAAETGAGRVRGPAWEDAGGGGGPAATRPLQPDPHVRAAPRCPCQARSRRQRPGSSVKTEAWSREGPALRAGSPAGARSPGQAVRPARGTRHGPVLAGAGHRESGASAHVTLPGMSRGAAREWLRTESGLMLLTS